MTRTERPIAVAVFEALNIGAVVLELVLSQAYERDPFEGVFTSGLWVALTLWITRGGSRVGRLIYTALALIGAAALLYAYNDGYDVSLFLAFRFTIELTLLTALLWWPSTTDWLKRRPDPAMG